MAAMDTTGQLFARYLVAGDHGASDYFALLKELVARRNSEGLSWQQEIDRVYALVHREILENQGQPTEPVTFGTSGWRGRLGKDIFVRSVMVVTAAIVELYRDLERDSESGLYLGVNSFDEAQLRGCVLGFDNRFDGGVLAAAAANVLLAAGFTVHYAGESTTGVLSAAVLELGAAFSVNLTPSHNPLEYGGYKYNAADAGPAATMLTERITVNARRLMATDICATAGGDFSWQVKESAGLRPFDSLAAWKSLVRRNKGTHGLDLDRIIEEFHRRDDIVVAVDSVHGASRLHIRRLFADTTSDRLITLRDTADVTFGGIAPEPSSANMRGVVAAINARPQRLKLGAIIDPDGDRIRFTDGRKEIGMNQFGAMAYHFLHEYRGKRGMVAKTVATSNMANRLAEAFGEELFEPKVGFKEFKPVIGRALVIFEESDGISIVGHTPEKDAYIGLLLALDMVTATGKNLSEYLQDIEDLYGAYHPDRDGVAVRIKGKELLDTLARLEKYAPGVTINVGGEPKRITEVITLDGRKMILDDGSWLMIRPSGTEPKIRFYVESRTADGTADLVATARAMLAEIGLL
ncbi:phosphoglucomutase [Desulfoprunum benzoelyticum]|uniref:Phosphomannomutase n=1 Tax=Desulfoprunum benzoelyticum TaxID=1506996 RepID=A0A840UUE6_9BACT|nr:phosphoglucomutase [Desulfoprunum benzoelyticum]MBB5346368.1 phosphomannomutase [Desulfoprunum benzoelyticum]MBM9528633.1 phosphoglucomutase [Desulfoprunum benzoelyticum]